MMGDKATQAEILLRLGTIEKLLIDGKGYQEIVGYADREWGIQGSQVDNYLKKIYTEWTRIHKERSKFNVNIAIERRENLLSRVRNKNERKMELKTLDSLDKVTGVARDVVEHRGLLAPQGQDFDYSRLNTAELRKLEEILAKATIQKEELPNDQDDPGHTADNE